MKLLCQLFKLYPDLKTCLFLILWAGTTPLADYIQCDVHRVYTCTEKVHVRTNLAYKIPVCMNARIYKNKFYFR